MGYVENVNAAALGSAGGAFLLITVISTMGTVEQALNTIFNVPQSRSYFRKFSDYLSVLFTVPLLIVAALGVTAVFSVRISEFPFVTQLLPYLFVWAGFFFLFIFFPYTKVKYGPALIGSFVTAVLFQLAQWGYVRFQVGVANYRAIYGAMATLPIFLVWIYIAWSVILFGAELTASVQRGDIPPMLGPMSPDFLYAATMHILIRLADARPPRRRRTSGRWRIRRTVRAGDILKPILDGLKAGGFVVEADANDRLTEPGPVPGAPVARPIVLADAIKSVDFRSWRERCRPARRSRAGEDGRSAHRPAQNDYARRHPVAAKRRRSMRKPRRPMSRLDPVTSSETTWRSVEPRSSFVKRQRHPVAYARLGRRRRADRDFARDRISRRASTGRLQSGCARSVTFTATISAGMATVRRRPAASTVGTRRCATSKGSSPRWAGRA